ncbi:MAG: AMP-binding protein, partial [Acidobacteria bacterium]|nr:AMP-binding protein [Acidobacteriota bacterium]
GRPIHGTRAYLLDRFLEPVPLGVPGEVTLSGDGLARGYLGRPRQTAERFVPDPFSTEAGGRLYRTGDLALHLPGGDLRLLGRIDHQVKVRGFRIEIGEIEAALRLHEEVREAAVVAAGSGGDRRLVAFLERREGEGSALLQGALRAFLGQRLPEYMVPSAFVVLDQLPAMANGKLNRRALKARAEELAAEGFGSLAPAAESVSGPRSAAEELLSSLWAEVLELDPARIGSAADFFELGGHSLAATRLTALIRQTFGVELPVREIFSHPTVARQVEALAPLRGQLTLPPPQPSGQPGPFPLSFAQHRLWILDRLSGPSAVYNMPGHVRIRGPLEVRALERAINGLVERQAALRIRIEDGDGGGQQRVEPYAPFPLNVVDVGGLSPEDAEEQALEILESHAFLPFDLDLDRLSRFSLVRLGDDHHLMLVNVHHIVSDGWSVGVMLREISELYSEYLEAGELAPDSPYSTPLPLQYTDYVLWQREWLGGDALQGQLEEWVEELEGAPQALELPTLGPRPTAESHEGNAVPFEVSRDLHLGIKALMAATRSTLFVVLETALAELLGRHGGADEVNIGTPVANRPVAEIQGLIGFFVNLLVLRNRLERGQTVRQRLAAVRETVLAAFSRQDLPFERLV